MSACAFLFVILVPGVDITPPPGWTVVTESPTETRFAAPAREGEFRDNLGVQVGPGADPKTVKASELRAGLERQYTKTLSDFQLRAFERHELGSNVGFHVEAAYRVDGFEVILDQRIVVSPDQTVIVTCSMGRERAKIRGCRQSLW